MAADLFYAARIGHWCPVCGYGPGDVCRVTTTGEPRWSLHFYRFNDAPLGVAVRAPWEDAESVYGDVHVTAQGVRWTYRGSRSQGWVDVSIQPSGEDETRHTVAAAVWQAVVEGSSPIARAE